MKSNLGTNLGTKKESAINLQIYNRFSLTHWFSIHWIILTHWVDLFLDIIIWNYSLLPILTLSLLFCAPLSQISFLGLYHFRKIWMHSKFWVFLGILLEKCFKNYINFLDFKNRKKLWKLYLVSNFKGVDKQEKNTTSHSICVTISDTRDIY